MKRLLMVEDCQGDKVLLELALRKAGLIFAMEWLKDGLTAYDRVSQLAPAPDLTILDINLPKRSGWDVLDRVRTLPWSQSSVVVFSSSASSIDLTKALERHCVYIRKPMNIGEYQLIAKQLMAIMDAVPC